MNIKYVVTEVSYNESRPNDEDEIESFSDVIKAIELCSKLESENIPNTNYVVLVEWWD